MISTPRLTLLAASTLLALGAMQPAAATTLYTLPAATAALETNTAVTASFSAGGGSGQLAFTLQGYATLDGDNFWIDILHVSLNGTEILSGTWNLGGGGVNRVLLDANGATFGSVANQQLSITVPVKLVAGNNQLVFSFESPNSFEGTPRAGFQGLGDEGWGLNAATVTAAPVPEPTPGALLLAGLGTLGVLARRRLG
jgi:hypothetical protein